MAELNARIDSRELTAWMVWERMNGPLGPARADHLTAMVCSVIANVNRGKRQRPYTAEQFMPKWGEGKAERSGPLSGEELLQKIRGINRAMGGR